MELGLTWPLQRKLKVAVPYGTLIDRGLCWDAHCITLHGRSSLLLVHCASRYTCVRFDLSAQDWERLDEIAVEEIQLALLEAGLEGSAVNTYLAQAGELQMTRTHGRREVAFLNRAWEDVLACDLLVDQSTQRQPMLNRRINDLLCRCVFEADCDTAQAHLERYFFHEKE